MATCISCSCSLPDDARFCPDCGDALPSDCCPACECESPPDAAYCAQCGVHKEQHRASLDRFEAARAAFAASDLPSLEAIGAELSDDDRHAAAIAELCDELVNRARFALREDFCSRIRSAIEDGDDRRLKELRGEVAEDPELFRLARDLVDLEAKRREDFDKKLVLLRVAARRRDEVGFTLALEAARRAAADRATWQDELVPWEGRADRFVRDQLEWPWYPLVVALACIPFPLGLWVVSAVSGVQRERWTATHPEKARAITRFGITAAASLGFLQVVGLGWLILGGY